jgi:2-polyprenyl-6-hydroxyphenyl methylase / 3-demethylubiquinone-9 3-methyltransferase
MTEPATAEHQASAGKSLDPDEVRRFAERAQDWWDPDGVFKPLHRIGPVRLTYIRNRLCKAFRRDPTASAPLAGLAILDIGCGGGLVCEPLCRLGADVTGIDPAADSIGVARAHAAGSGLAVAYETATAEALVQRGQTFDAVLLLEVVEHVADMPAFVATVAELVRPGGLLIASTISRTLKSYALAIVAAEYVLRWVPAGTHHWDRFVTPDELKLAMRRAGLMPEDVTGMIYNPLADEWRLGRDSDVNYFATATKPA